MKKHLRRSCTPTISSCSSKNTVTTTSSPTPPSQTASAATFHWMVVSHHLDLASVLNFISVPRNPPDEKLTEILFHLSYSSTINEHEMKEMQHSQRVDVEMIDLQRQAELAASKHTVA